MKISRYFLSTAIALAALSVSLPGHAEDAEAYLSRAARGDITQPGGARRQLHQIDLGAPGRLRVCHPHGEASAPAVRKETLHRIR